MSGELMKPRALLLAPIALSCALLLSSCAGSSQSSGATPTSDTFINAADVDLSGEWQRVDAKSWQTINTEVNDVPPADVTIDKVADGFYQYTYSVAIPESDPPVVRDGEETRNFQATFRMAIAPDGTLRGIDVEDPLVATYWVRDENTVDAVLQEGGPDGAIVTYTMRRSEASQSTS